MHNIFPEYIYNKNEEIFDSAYRDFNKAIVTTKALSKSQKERTGAGFVGELHFKSKKNDVSNSIEIRARNIKQKNNKLMFWPNTFTDSNTKFSGFLIKDILPKLDYSCRLQRLRTGQYYLIVPTLKTFKNSETNSVGSLDPGVVIFQTLYDPDGCVMEFGGNFDRIVSLGVKADKLQSKLSKHKNQMKRLKKRDLYKLRKERLNIYNKIRNLIKDAHQKITKFLSDNYKQILLPKFNTKDISNKIKRNIGNKIVRSMMTWSHYKFHEMLNYKMARTGGSLISCTEEFTSKTCSKCGRIKHELKGGRVYRCKHCGLDIGRDVNGARNIYIKNCSLLYM